MKRLHDDHDSKACVLRHLNMALQSEGYGVTSLAAHLEITEGYISRVLNGESWLGVRFIMSLPQPVLKRLLQYGCEYFGAVVTWPADDQVTALKQKIASQEWELRQLRMAAEPVRKVG